MEWRIGRQSKKFAKELKKKGYEPRKPWDVGIWIILLFFGCDDRVEDPVQANVVVTMLRVERNNGPYMDNSYFYLGPLRIRRN